MPYSFQEFGNGNEWLNVWQHQAITWANGDLSSKRWQVQWYSPEMTQCLTAPSHYLSQWWLIIKEVTGSVVFTWSQLQRKCSRYHICVGNLTSIGSDNGLSPNRRQAIIWTNAGILLIGPLATNFSEILIEIHTFSFKKMHLKMLSGKWRPSCLGLNVLT